MWLLLGLALSACRCLPMPALLLRQVMSIITGWLYSALTYRPLISCCLLWVRVSFSHQCLLPSFISHCDILAQDFVNLRRCTPSKIHSILSLQSVPALLLISLPPLQNGGTNCPACRSVSTNVAPSRILQVMVDVLLRADSSRARTDREKQQADEIYKPGFSFRVRI